MNIDDEKQFAEYNKYLCNCDECATLPTVSGAFQWAWRSCESNKIKKLEAALRPFADHPAFHAPDNWAVTYLDDAHEVPGVTARDFQIAKTAMTANVEVRG